MCHPLHLGVRSLNGTVRLIVLTFIQLYHSWKKLFIRSVVATFCGQRPCFVCMQTVARGNFGYVVGHLIDFGLSGISGYHSCGCGDVIMGEDSFS